MSNVNEKSATPYMTKAQAERLRRARLWSVPLDQLIKQHKQQEKK